MSGDLAGDLIESLRARRAGVGAELGDRPRRPRNRGDVGVELACESHPRCEYEQDAGGEGDKEGPQGSAAVSGHALTLIAACAGVNRSHGGSCSIWADMLAAIWWPSARTAEENPVASTSPPTLVEMGRGKRRELARGRSASNDCMLPGADLPAVARTLPSVKAAERWLEEGEASQRMMLWHGTPHAADVRATGFSFDVEGVGHGGGPAIWLSDSPAHAKGYGTLVRVAAKFRKPLMVTHVGDSDWAGDFEDALKREGVDVSKYPHTPRGFIASPSVVARKEGFDAVAVRMPDTVYGPEVPEHLRVSPGVLIVTAFDLDSLRVVSGKQQSPRAVAQLATDASSPP